jgi:hypothetical protein
MVTLNLKPTGVVVLKCRVWGSVHMEFAGRQFAFSVCVLSVNVVVVNVMASIMIGRIFIFMFFLPF